MKKLMNFSVLLAVLVAVSACSRFLPEKEIVTVPTVVETPEIEAPVIRIVPRPDPIKMRNADIVVVTEANLEEVIARIKTEQGDFVLYAMTAQSFEALALSFEQIKKFIEQQNAIILYYEEAVKPKENE
tara:strand:+ start:7 stop:393 length:387 start_codon:yes stop_codon:yes gene_type:complete